MHCFFVLGLLSLGGTAAAVPDDTCGPSLEWLTCAADVVVVGHVKKIERMRVGDKHFEECTVEVKEAIRGQIKSGKPLVFAFYQGQVDGYVNKAIQSEAGILVFLLKTEGGKLFPVPCQTYPIVGLSAPGQYAIDRKFRVVKDRKEVLDICRDAAKKWDIHIQKNPDAWRNLRNEYVAVPPESAAYSKLCRGGNCTLLVPKCLGK